VLQLLLEWHAAQDVTTSLGSTAFHFACFAGEPECVAALAQLTTMLRETSIN
jgi:hypothetical protein